MSEISPGLTRGRLLARALAGSWRASPTPFADVDSIAEIATIAAHSGSAALLCRRLLDTSTPAIESLRQARRLQILDEARARRHLCRLLAALREVDITPIVVKGLAIASRYPEAGCRPFGDLDVVVSPAQKALVEEVLRTLDIPIDVDLHTRLPHFSPTLARDARQRVRKVSVAENESETYFALCDEDHLRLLALHMMGHGAWRSVWLCDLALLIEQARDFDWDYFLRGTARDRDALLVALSLCAEVLGADVPPSRRVRVPSWVRDCLYRTWGERFLPHDKLQALPDKGGLWHAVKERWSNPIQASYWMHAPYNEWPRAPIQIADYAVRAFRFAVELARKNARAPRLTRQ